MDDIKKLKKIRAVTRTAVTKVMNKLEKEFDSQSIDLLLEHFDYLNEHIKQLRELDNKIQNIIQVEDEFDAEIQSAFGYNEKISVLCSKIQIKIKTLTKSDSSVSSQATVNVQNDSFNNSINGSSVNSNKNVNSVRLPKLQIDKYFGDPCLWFEFWNKFQNSIDKNETLTKVGKFSYLKSLLGGAAGNVVNGFALSDDNYDNALILLKERFGREGIVVNAHMSKLLNLYPVKDSNNVIGLRKLYDICKIQIRSLESLNVTFGMYGHLLQPILLKLLPEDLVLDFNRKQLGKKEESDNQNISHSRQNKNHIPLNSNSSRSFEYFTPVIEKKCIYCDSDKHGSELCKDLSVDEKKDFEKARALFLCLEKNHRIRDCKKKEMRKCNKKHNQSLCFQSVRKTRDLDVENNVVSAVSHCNYNIKNKEPEVKNAECSVLLQTCTSCVRSPLDDKLETVRLLLDNGSMRSFITREISRQLKLPVVWKETLSVYSFGAKQATEKTYNVVKVIIENRDEPTLNIEIEALETDQITATNIPVPKKNRVAFTADIKQAFLQIQLDEEDRDVTRFLWNENPDGPEELIQSYRMTRVLFGVSSARFYLLQRSSIT
ncbi:uncharacterized protein TNCV_1186041 [Trichonephila clavipes]|nr:uncharacterized protein TNCV_1186041 [Trichonephila clavipes]